jgi:hypothetical protein
VVIPRLYYYQELLLSRMQITRTEQMYTNVPISALRYKKCVNATDTTNYLLADRKHFGHALFQLHVF